MGQKNTRAQIVSDDTGSPAIPGINHVDLTGLWGSAFGRGGVSTQELNALRPERDEASSVSAVAARAVDLLVQTASSLPLEVTTAAGEPVNHYLERLFNTVPNSFQSGLAFRQAIWQRLIHHGEAFVVLDRGISRVSDPRSAVVFHGRTRVRITPKSKTYPHGEVLAFELYIDKEWVTLAPSEVIWLRFPGSDGPWSSRAPITAALDAIGLQVAARVWQAGQLANGGTPTGIVWVGNPESEDDFYAAKAEIERALTGPSSAGRIAVAAGGDQPVFIRTGFTSAEVGYLDTLNVAGEEIALALGVPLDLVGGQRTYANVDASWKILWEGTVLPRLELVSSEINRQLLAAGNLEARFSTTNVSALQEGKDAVAARITTAVQNDIVLLDEARAVLGFDPLPNGKGQVLLSEFRATVSPQPLPTTARDIVNVNVRTVAEPTVDQAPQVTDTAVAPTVLVRGISAERANKTLDRLEASTRRAIGRLAKAQLDEALRKLNRSRSTQVRATASSVFNAASWVERAYDYLLPIISAALETGAQVTMDNLATDLNLDVFLIQAAEDRARVLADQVNATTEKVLNERLAAAAVVDSLSVDEFSKVIQATFEDLAGYRADAIARTEMIGQFNAGSRTAAVQSGVVSQREWLATGGQNSRPEHNALSGTRTIGMDDAWPNGLMFPGDPSGDPSQTVNCRCVELFVTDLGTEA